MTDEVKTIDLDDPMFSEPGDYDPSKDIEERTPPPELDSNGNTKTYTLKLSVADNPKGEKKPYPKEMKNGKYCLALNINAQIVSDDEWNNKFVPFPYGMVTTAPANGTTSAMDLARLLSVVEDEIPTKLSALDQMAYVSSILDNEPEIGARFQWKAYCGNCKEEISALKGESRWPERKNADGKVIGHKASTDCPKCGNELTARVEIAKKIKVVGLASSAVS